MRALVRDYSNQGHLVVDLCMRHGITGVACQIEQRAFIGMEFEAESYTLAVNRFKEQFEEQAVEQQAEQAEEMSPI